MAQERPKLILKPGGPSKAKRFGKTLAKTLSANVKTLAVGTAIAGAGVLGGVGIWHQTAVEARKQQVVSVAQHAFDMGREVGHMENGDASASSLSGVYSRHGAFYSVLAHHLTGPELSDFNSTCREANANPIVAADILFEHKDSELGWLRQSAAKAGDPYAKEILQMKAAVIAGFAKTSQLKAIAQKVRKQEFFIGGPVDALYGRIKDRAPAIHYNSVIRPDGTVETRTYNKR